jgi:hypothetical protein
VHDLIVEIEREYAREYRKIEREYEREIEREIERVVRACEPLMSAYECLGGRAEFDPWYLIRLLLATELNSVATASVIVPAILLCIVELQAAFCLVDYPGGGDGRTRLLFEHSSRSHRRHQRRMFCGHPKVPPIFYEASREARIERIGDTFGAGLRRGGAYRFKPDERKGGTQCEFNLNCQKAKSEISKP